MPIGRAFDLVFAYSCECPAGFSGARCESNVDDCVDHKCANNATCVDLVQTYECSCSKGFMGTC